MEKLIKNLEHAVPFAVADQVAYEDGKVVSLTLSQTAGVGLTLFAIDKGEGLSTHAAPGDAMAFILDGEVEITIDGVKNLVKAGSAIIMPKGIPHSLKAVERFKMLLTVVK